MVELKTRFLIDWLKISVNPETYLIEFQTIQEAVNAIIERVKENFPVAIFEVKVFRNGYGIQGYNRTVVLSIKETKTKINIRWLQSEKRKFDNFVNQKVSIEFTGDSLQEIRSGEGMLTFVKKLEALNKGKITASRIDITRDVFNDNTTTKHFVDLFMKNKYLSQASFSTAGLPTNPTIYIGKSHSNRALVIYDKIQEGKDKQNIDEPEIYDSCESWVRYEFCLTNERSSATIAWRELIKAKTEDELYEIIKNIHLNLLRKRCKFLKRPRDYYANLSRDAELDPAWKRLLKGKVNEIRFYERPTKDTLENRGYAFITKNICGAKFVEEYSETFGMLAFQNLINARKYYKKYGRLPSAEENEKRTLESSLRGKE